MDRLGRLLETRKNSPSLGNIAGISEEKPGFFSRIGDDLKKRGDKVASQAERDQTIGSDVLQLGGQAAGFATDIVTEGVKSLGEVTGITENIIKPAVEAVKPVAVDILETPVGQAGLQAIKAGAEAYGKWKEANPEQAGNLEAVVNIGALIPVAKGAQVTGNALKQGTEAVVDATVKTAGKVGDVAKGGVGVVKDVWDATKRIPDNFSTNSAAREEVRQTISELPTPIAKEAAQDGIEVPDVKALYQMADDIKKIEVNTRPKEGEVPKIDPETGKPVEVNLSERDAGVASGAVKRTNIAKELFEAVKSYSKGESKTDPIEIVGRPIVARLKTLETAKNKVGAELGKIAKEKLGILKAKEIATPVYEALRSVPGLKGIKVDPKGNIDFSETVLATMQNKSARSYIQKAFLDAIKPGSGYSKHLLRQEFFEILGGKKKSLTNMTDTEEKAIDAIRKGLSDVLEGKEPRYKTLSAQFRKIVQPVQDLRKALKTGVDDAEDILEMKAGLLARRLTSTAKSNPEIRALLRRLDEALGDKAQTTVNVEALQDLYNIFDKYYDIAPQTGFQGQVKEAVTKGATGIMDFVQKTATKIAGESDAVRQKALEKIFNELFK